MTDKERMIELATDPRVHSIIRDARDILLTLRPGWLHKGQPHILGRRLDRIHADHRRFTAPNPKRPPELRNWRVDARLPGSRWWHPGKIVERYAGSRFWRVEFQSLIVKTRWYKTGDINLANYQPPWP